MSWTDYTHQKHFGSGLFRPHSDLIADIVLAADNMLAADTAFAKWVTPFPSRDTLIIQGKEVTFLVVSRLADKQYPFFCALDAESFWNHPEDLVLRSFGIPRDHAARLDNEGMREALRLMHAFVDPLIITLPTTNVAQGEAVADARRQHVLEAGRLLVLEERKYYDAMLDALKPKDIFLSHKSVDKGLVREVAATLRSIGFSVWLDEDKLKAGANLERGLRDGFTTSCAAVFFITPHFLDTGYLASEIEYAVAEKRIKGDRFDHHLVA